MADPTAAEMISQIKTTLKALYAKTAQRMSFEERETVTADISKLEASLRFWEGKSAASSGTSGGTRVTGITFGRLS